MKYIFLTIANFNIKIDFQLPNNSPRKKTFVKKIVTGFKKFINNTSGLKTDFKIIIKDNDIKSVHFIPDNKLPSLHTFMKFYEKKTSGSYITYSYLGIEQLQYLLLTIIEKLLFTKGGFALYCDSFLPSGSIVMKDNKNHQKNLIFIRKIKNTFYAFPNAFELSDKSTRSYPIKRIILPGTELKKNLPNTIINKIIPLTNLVKTDFPHLESANKTKSMKNFFLLLNKVELFQKKR